jgi:hypothetical protein
MRKPKQREFMRQLVKRFGANAERVIREYANAERNGQVERKSNLSGFTPEQYARALWQDAVKKNWISGV